MQYSIVAKHESRNVNRSSQIADRSVSTANVERQIASVERQATSPWDDKTEIGIGQPLVVRLSFRVQGKFTTGEMLGFIKTPRDILLLVKNNQTGGKRFVSMRHDNVIHMDSAQPFHQGHVRAFQALAV